MKEQKNERKYKTYFSASIKSSESGKISGTA